MTDIKEELSDYLKELHNKQYTWYDYISGMIWTLWVNTYGWYFNTQQYKDYLLSKRFLEQWRNTHPPEIINTLKDTNNNIDGRQD